MTRAIRRAATLDDVARAAGVSRSTASRVIAGTGPASAAARDRVRAAADRLGYAPDPVAKSLVTGVGYRLVVAVAGMTPQVIDDPYVSRFLTGAARVCAAHGVAVSLEWLPLRDAGQPGGEPSAAPGSLVPPSLVSEWGGPPTPAPVRLRQLATDRSVRGVLLLNATEEVLAAVPARLHGRIISVGIGSPDVPSFDIDNAGGATAVLQHMYATGRRRIAMITGPDWLPCTQRPVEAYRRTMQEAGLAPRLVRGDFTPAGGRRGVREVLRRWPDTDAIFAISDAPALGAIAELRACGVRVPDDVAVAGFDDIPLAELSAPALTTATHPVDQIAAGAAAAVLNEVRVPPVTIYPSELVLRESA